jgi:hypothetical protein
MERNRTTLWYSVRAGNLYGTTEVGGMFPPNGVVFELSPSDSGWSETILYNVAGQPEGSQPFSGLMFDPAGISMAAGGQFDSGSVFELSPGNGGFTYSVLYGGFNSAAGNGGGPQPKLVMDQAGNLYGTQYEGGSFGEIVGCFSSLRRRRTAGYLPISTISVWPTDNLRTATWCSIATAISMARPGEEAHSAEASFRRSLHSSRS